MLSWNGLLVLFVFLAGFPWNTARPQLHLLSLTVSDVKPRISHCDSQNLQYKTHPEFWPFHRRIFKTSLYYKMRLILETRREIGLVARQLKITMRHSERQLCNKFCTLYRVGVDTRPMNVEIYVGTCICFICIPKIRHWRNISISYFYYHSKVTMVTANYLRLRCHFHKESFGYPQWNCLFDEENTYFLQIKYYIAAF